MFFRRLSPYHFLVLLVVEVENRLQHFKPVENFIVPCHVGGQDASRRHFKVTPKVKRMTQR